ncbi:MULTISPECIES: hypothetical protein [unclassified Luteimonas]|uniref:hypothetical protein n=1 Tax=unclassified Luteimonas TaxID=2629088 RepID=UPI0018F08717|nr:MULTISPECIES: hypothetical protein [unclassified Luteimonas]MBJ6980128.1 hypothetical protein [Luteimonas sp. MC1895]MBJ6985393.1 hypothetical protein [Luteimonas sp. MC1750]QQO05348.1 hypothetical protein JGR68_10955 [Luteimonas sp. MC1750]
MNPSFAQAQPQPMGAGEAGYDAALQAATAPLRDEFGSSVELAVERMDRLGNWVFVLGNMRSPGGGRPDVSGTRFAEAAGQGAMSDVYAALLRREAISADDAAAAGGDGVAATGASPAAPAEAAARDQAALPQAAEATTGAPAGAADGAWDMVDFAIGPGDVAWLGWPQEHAAPRALFGF